LTRIRIKTDSLRKEATITNSPYSNTDWRVEMAGYRSVDYKAETIGGAADVGMVLAQNLVKEENNQPKRRGNPESLQRFRQQEAQRQAEQNGALLTPPVPSPVDQPKKGKRSDAENLSKVV